jgi:F-type H+-transporting ATPase subunit b
MTAPMAAAIAFIAFIALLGYFGAHRRLLEVLDKRAQAVKDELAASQHVLAEANLLLTDLAKRRELAEREAEKIVRIGQERAEEMTRAAAAQMAEFVTRRTEQAERRIALAQDGVKKLIQVSAMDVAVRAAEHMLRGEIGASVASDLISNSIKEVGTRLK